MTKGSVNSPFVVHFHQPVGQFEGVMRRIYERSYKLWLRTFEGHPELKFTVHLSGPLLDWLLKNYPEYIERVKRLVGSGQLEIIGSAYYEPALPLIPDGDKVDQINLFSERLRRIFGLKPEGCWLTERVWEPHLPKPLAEAGMKYVLVDDSHFFRAGYREPETFYPYLTEEQGWKVVVFPINEKLRYLLPAETLDKAVKYLDKARSPEEDRVLIYFTDAEKYGEWIKPSTAKRLLEKHLRMIKRTNWVKSIHLGEYLRKFPPRGLIYLPSASYDKMMEWSKGNFRNFLVKYEESNLMHKKMLYVREKLAKAFGQGLRGRARMELYRGQCNDAYWHGMFGGIYLPLLRQAVYKHLIQAERMAERVLGFSRHGIEVKEVDFDRDGEPEVLLETECLNVYVKPSQGGHVFEMDFKGKINHNFASVLAQYREPYHHRWRRKPAPDWHRRAISVDHCLRPGLKLEEFLKRDPRSELADFPVGRFDYKLLKEGVRLWRRSRVKTLPVLLEKTISLRPGFPRVEIRYEIENVGTRPIDLRFAPEFSIAPAFPTEGRRRQFWRINGRRPAEVKLKGRASLRASTGCQLVDNHHGLILELAWEGKANLWLAPLLTRVLTDKGPQVIYQGTALMPMVRLSLEKGDKKSFSVSLEVIEQ